MIKRFCDHCEKEITGKNSVFSAANPSRLTIKHKRGGVSLGVEVMTSKDGLDNDGDFCKHCIIDAINQLDDRPKQQ